MAPFCHSGVATETGTEGSNMGFFGKKDKEDGGQDLVGQNPTGRERKSSAGKRRQKDNKLFGGTAYEKPKGGK